MAHCITLNLCTHFVSFGLIKVGNVHKFNPVYLSDVVFLWFEKPTAQATRHSKTDYTDCLVKYKTPFN